MRAWELGQFVVLFSVIAVIASDQIPELIGTVHRGKLDAAEWAKSSEGTRGWTAPVAVVALKGATSLTPWTPMTDDNASESGPVLTLKRLWRILTFVEGPLVPLRSSELDLETLGMWPGGGSWSGPRNRKEAFP